MRVRMQRTSVAMMRGSRNWKKGTFFRKSSLSTTASCTLSDDGMSLRTSFSASDWFLEKSVS